MEKVKFELVIGILKKNFSIKFHSKKLFSFFGEN